MAETLKLIYIIGTYPGLTTTFIDREIRFLRRWGVDLKILAVRRPPSHIPLSLDQRELQENVLYLLPAGWFRVVWSQLYFLLLRPVRYLATLVYLATRPHPGARARLMSFVHFSLGVYAAYLLRDFPFHELHAHFVDRAATLALVVGRLLRKPYSLSIHAGPDIFVNPVLLREKILEARHVATCTLFNKTHLESVIGQDLGHKISYIHHGLDLSKYQSGLPVSNGRPLILSVGQLAERKGFPYLIRACRELKDQGYDFACHIIGRGPQGQELEDLISRLSLEDRVVLCGALPHEQVIEEYRRSIMFVLPCVKSRDGNMDGIPNVLAEAMAMQRPVISTCVSAIPELVTDEVNGLLVPPGDDTALLAAMRRLLDDPVLRQSLGRKGRESIVSSFDVEENVRHFARALWPDWFNRGLNDD
jgi:glycosyltransferase involved in cell wall biosynthesis